jgi:hypothetical protein
VTIAARVSATAAVVPTDGPTLSMGTEGVVAPDAPMPQPALTMARVASVSEPIVIARRVSLAAT